MVFIKVNREHKTVVEYAISQQAEVIAALRTTADIKYEKVRYGQYKICV